MVDAPIAYIDRTRAYYLALGFAHPYRWAAFDDGPFAPLRVPLDKARVGIVTTARLKQGAGDNTDTRFHEVYAETTDRMPDLGITHVAIDRDHTSAEDIGTWFPLAAMRRAETAGRIGAMGPRFFGLPTNRSQRVTSQVDGPALVAQVLADTLDAVVLVANCPVCHQSVSFAARALEAAGVVTVIMGCALDIVERMHVPRFVFSDFPLGNAAGRPGDVESQDATLALALDLLGADGPRATLRSPLKWPGDGSWKRDYANPDRLSPQELATRRRAFDASEQASKGAR